MVERMKDVFIPPLEIQVYLAYLWEIVDPYIFMRAESMLFHLVLIPIGSKQVHGAKQIRFNHMELYSISSCKS